MRIEFSEQLTALIKAQRNQDQKKKDEELATKMYNAAIASGDPKEIQKACDRLDTAANHYDAAILERVDTERTYRTWVEREQAHDAERKLA